MAELDRLKSGTVSEEKLPDGHAFYYTFNVYRLDNIHRTFYPLEFETRCRPIATSWVFEMKYERVACGFYNFSITLKRTDSLHHRVGAIFHVSFYDCQGTEEFQPISSSKERVVPGDGVTGVLKDIPAENLGEVAMVKVKITIRNCHVRADFQCAAKVNTDKNCIILSKL